MSALCERARGRRRTGGQEFPQQERADPRRGSDENDWPGGHPGTGDEGQRQSVRDVGITSNAVAVQGTQNGQDGRGRCQQCGSTEDRPPELSILASWQPTVHDYRADNNEGGER